MSSFPQCSEIEGATTMRPLLNTPNPTQQVVIMAQSPPSLKPKVDYSKRFSKEFMLSLSFLQMLSAALAITTQMILLSTDEPEAVGYVVQGYGVECFMDCPGFLEY